MANRNSNVNHLATFTQYGISLEADSTGKNAKGICPFCESGSAFSVNTSNGLWKCWNCEESGNNISFVGKIWKRAFSETTSADYNNLTELRPGITPQILEEFGLALDLDTWLIPAFQGDGLEPANIFRWDIPKDGKKNPVISSANIKLKLFNAVSKTLKENPDAPIYITEGPWDMMAMRWVLKRTKTAGHVVAFPGMAQWKDEWSDVFHRRDVIFLFDNSTKASQYMQKCCTRLEGVAYKTRMIEWPPGTETNYDIRDLVCENSKTPKKALTVINKCLLEYSSDTAVMVDHPSKWKRERITSRPTFEKVLKTFNQYFYLDKTMEEGLAIMLATVFSNSIPGDPLWVFLVGPPGAGKTAMLKSVLNAEKCFYASTITSESLVSGYTVGVDGNEDPSLLPKLKYRCLVLKDYTEVMGLYMAARESLYALLRGIYDGYVSKPFGNFQTRTYKDIYLSMVAGVTDEIHSHNYAALGERFLKVSYITADHDAISHVRQAVKNMSSTIDSSTALREIVADFLDVDAQNNIPKPPKWIVERIIPLATLIGFLRASVSRSKKGELSYRPRPEIGTRLSIILIKLGQSLCLVYNKTRMDTEIYSIMQRVAFDTAYGWHLDIFMYMIRDDKEMWPIDTIAENIRTGKSNTKRCLDDMVELGIVDVEELTAPGQRGGRRKWYILTPFIKELWEKSKAGDFFQKKPKTKSKSDSDSNPDLTKKTVSKTGVVRHRVSK